MNQKDLHPVKKKKRQTTFIVKAMMVIAVRLFQPIKWFIIFFLSFMYLYRLMVPFGSYKNVLCLMNSNVLDKAALNVSEAA